LGNLLDNEMARWWKTRMWWVQCLIWVSLSIMMTGPGAWDSARFSYLSAVGTYTDLAGIFLVVGVIVIMQGVLVGEKKDGTAAWVLSKPAARPAFILAKVIANALGVLITMVAVCGGVFYVLCLAHGKVVPKPDQFLGALAITFLDLLWYMTLMLMVGALSNSRGPVIGVPAALVLLQNNLISWLPALRYVLPWTLVASMRKPAAIEDLLLGRSIASCMPTVAVVAAECILFVVIAVWKFNREEL
jgi:ABC-2 type transport system permease protein